ncbi:MAG: hypothetical protein IPO35_18630 [Uliginosibacterium sp.]|nr:hypothetical protein [Uliginosibacterium sp.]
MPLAIWLCRVCAHAGKAVVLPGFGASVASTEFIVLRPKKGGLLSVEALLIYLRSRLPQIVFKWSQDGSNHPRFDERELLNLPLPRIDFRPGKLPCCCSRNGGRQRYNSYANAGNRD